MKTPLQARLELNVPGLTTTFVAGKYLEDLWLDFSLVSWEKLPKWRTRDDVTRQILVELIRDERFHVVMSRETLDTTETPRLVLVSATLVRPVGHGVRPETLGSDLRAAEAIVAQPRAIRGPLKPWQDYVV